MRQLALVVIAAATVWIQSPQTPRFSAGVDIVEIDATVLDKDHKPVHGLKAGDFTILEDGKPQTIVSFDEVHVQPPMAPSAPWMREIPQDVETNVQADHNLFVIVIDDALITYTKPYASDDKPFADVKDAPYKLSQTKAVAKRVVEGLTDRDVAAVIFSFDNTKGTNFTSDRSKLLKSIDSLTVGPPIGCRELVASASALLSSVEALATVKHRRKTVFYIAIGTDVPLIGQTDPCRSQAQDYIDDALRAAQRGNVNVYTFDPSGLRALISPFDRLQIQSLQETAENTGGRAFVNTNDPEAHVAEVLDEARSYYLIGYSLPVRADDSRFHRLEVKVDRPDVEVHTRKTRFDPKPERAAASAVSPLAAAVSGFLPSTDVGLSVTTAAFAGEAGKARVEVGLTGRLPEAMSGDAPRDTIGVTLRAFTVDGRAVSTVDQSVPVQLVKDPPDRVAAAAGLMGPVFQVASELALPPGRYDVRISAESHAAGKTGSVYTDIVVPDFSKEPLSLSGILLTESSGASLRGDALNTLVSTAGRAFAKEDHVQAFMRVYQGGKSELAAVSLRTRVVDGKNVTVLDRSEALPPGAFSRDRRAEYFVRLPLSSLTPGEYWMSFEASIGKRTVRRDVRFAVR